MSSNLGAQSGNESFSYDPSHHLSSNGDNVFDPALSQVQAEFSHNDNPIGHGLAQHVDPQYYPEPAAHGPYNEHWNAQATQVGGNASHLNQFDNSYYQSDPYSNVHPRQPYANDFNYSQFTQSHGSSTPLYAPQAQPYSWQPLGNQTSLAQHQNVAPTDLQSGHFNAYDDSNAHVPITQSANQQQINYQPAVSQLETESQQAPANVPIHWPLPQGQEAGRFFTADTQQLEQSYSCGGMGNFVHLGTEPLESTMRKLTLPAYVPRKSRSEIADLLAQDSSLKAKHNKRIRAATTSSTQSTSSHGEDGRPISAARAPKGSANETSSHGESSDDESDASSSEEELPPIPSKKPSNPSDATSYDTIEAVWLPPYKSATRQQIQKGLQSYGDIVSTIRRRWRSDALAVETAEEKKDKDLPLLKERVTLQRQLLDVSLKAVLKHAHRDILEHFSRSVPLMGAFAASLQVLAKEKDWSVDLAKSLLEVLSRGRSMLEAEIVEKFVLVRLISRFFKRGDDVVKSFAGAILESANAALEKQKKEGKTIAAASSPSSDAKKKAVATDVPSVAGSKRKVEADSRTSQPSKKVASSTTVSQAGNPTKKSTSGTEGKTQAKPANVQKITAKPTNLFTSLQPTYKKTLTTASAGPAPSKSAATTVDKKPFQASSAISAQPPSFSFAATMANLTRPKEAEPAPKKKEDTPPETPEQKARRLRKEKRRGLRVSFKPDPDLVQIRTFEHHPDEEVAHNASEVRDVKNLVGEGRTFKLKQQAKQRLRSDPNKMDLDEDDEDEDEENSDTDIQKDYVSPSQIDFIDMPELAKDGNYSRFAGGSNEPFSPEAEAQKLREADRLLVVYSRASDIPPSPKEPPFELGKAQEPKKFGSPPNKVLSRLPSSGNFQQPVFPAVPADLSAILAQLSKQPNVQTPAPQQQSSKINLQQIIAEVNKANEQPQQQVQSPQPQFPVWNPAPSGYGQAPSAQQTFQAQPAGNSDLSAILAKLQGQLPMTTPQAQAPYASAAPTSSTQYQPQIYENEDRRRLREGPMANEGRTESDKNKSRKGQSIREPPKYLYPCKFWVEGKCTKGQNCTYRHDLT